jgi:hypothetical protein
MRLLAQTCLFTTRVVWLYSLVHVSIGAEVASGVHAGEFYVYDGVELRKCINEDPAGITPVWWEIRLFRGGSSTDNLYKSWGLITGRTAKDVVEELRRCQEIELDGNATFGGTRAPSPVFTYFNPLGPIARVRRNMQRGSALSASLRSRAASQLIRSSQAMRSVALLRGLFTTHSSRPTAFIRARVNEVAAIERQVNVFTDELKRAIDLELDTIERDVSGLEYAITEAEGAIGSQNRQLMAQGVVADQTAGAHLGTIRAHLDQFGSAAAEIYSSSDPAGIFRKLHSIANSATQACPAHAERLRNVLAEMREVTSGPAEPNQFAKALKLLEAAERELNTAGRAAP